jgi:hypothetical protein
MVDVVGLYNGLRFNAGVREPTYYDLAVNGTLTHLDNQTKRLRTFEEQVNEPVNPADSYNFAFNRPSTHQVLSAKADFDAIIMGRVDYDKNSGKQAPSGYVRHQMKGLIYDPQRPIDIQNIMPLANNFYADSLNVLGNVN